MVRANLIAVRLYAVSTHHMHAIPMQCPYTTYTAYVRYMRTLTVYGIPRAGDLFYRTFGQSNDLLMHIYICNINVFM